MISSVPINHESVRKNLFENCGWCKLHRPADCPKRTVPSPVAFKASTFSILRDLNYDEFSEQFVVQVEKSSVTLAEILSGRYALFQ